jgi:CRP/FNR family transcriptional regulator
MANEVDTLVHQVHVDYAPLTKATTMNAIDTAIVPGIRPDAIPVPFDRLNCCTTCTLHDICIPAGLDPGEMQQLDQMIDQHRRVGRDRILYRMNDPFTTLYAIRFGQFKTYQLTADGVEQITGFHMAGEFLGLDAISKDRHPCYASALEDSEVCELPFSRLEHLFPGIPVLLRHFHRMMSQEITRDQSAMLSLGNMNAEQRFALFLLNLSARHKARGYSATSFQLRMSREEIGNYLGLRIESISRLISRFAREGKIAISQRDVELLDLDALRQLGAGGGMRVSRPSQCML